MLAPPAEPFPLWTLAKDNAGEYDFGSKVSYKRNGRGVAEGYRANSLYKKGTGKNPEEYAGWSIDPYYAEEWSPSVKYKELDKVWYEVGDSKAYSKYYLYFASVRYFGGTSPPNEEEDDDGIRTWQLFTEPSANATKTLWMPMRKIAGNWGDVTVTGTLETGYGATGPIGPLNYPFDNTAPDNFVYTLNQDLSPQATPRRDFYGVNSRFEGNPYDRNVYSFSFYQNNELIPRKKGVHMAQVLKESGTPAYALNEREWGYTFYAFGAGAGIGNRYPFNYGFGNFNGSLGFSIEMWPNDVDSNVELVTMPINGSRVGLENPNNAQFSCNGSVSDIFGGDVSPDNGFVTQPTPAEFQKLYISARFNCPTFQGRKFDMRFFVSKISYYWKLMPSPNGVGDGYYRQVFNPVQTSLVQMSFDTKDESFRHKATDPTTNLQYDLPWVCGMVDLQGISPPRTSTSVGSLGFKFD
jgi:hypothetical protein